MSETQVKLPLFVDLDGTLIKTDLTLESLLLLLRKNPLYLLLVPFWLLRGRAFLKHQLVQRVQPAMEGLPYNDEFLQYLKEQKEQGRSITLISASNQQVVDRVHAHLGLFNQAIGSDENTNLKSGNKLRRIQQLTSQQPFAYAGNASADLPIWKRAKQVLMVNCDDGLVRRLGNPVDTIQRFDAAGSSLGNLWRAMRPHQWLKNGLIFLPLILSHRVDEPVLLLQAVIGFIGFSLCASSVYLLNDMLDLASDRQHRSKRQRPFASGELDLAWGFAAAPGLLLAAFAIALLLPGEFLLVLFLYWLLTSLYSFYLKRLLLVDVVTLALLYTIRIIAGSAAIGVITTNYLLAFSLFLFLGLAMVKRITELSNLLAAGGTNIRGRGYNTDHLQLLATTGGISNLLAVGVFALYINDPDTTRLYGSPTVLWLICPLLFYLLARIWSFALRGKLDEDPILFAATDHLSQAITLACGFLIWLAI